MGDFGHRVCDSLLSSAVVPVSVRQRLMRMLGYRIGQRVEIWAGANLRSKLITIGDDVFVNVGFFYGGNAEVTIGNRVALAPIVRFITATHEIGPSDRRCTSDAIVRPIHIEDGCWIGANVMILPGVTVGRGCVIAAGAVVTTSTKPDGMYMGVPARRVRDLPG